ncbi:MAG: hypothetical protein QM831_31490 [Kofleriaceae bacterium]
MASKRAKSKNRIEVVVARAGRQWIHTREVFDDAAFATRFMQHTGFAPGRNAKLIN